MDVLSATGFLNYYGRVADSRNIVVKPVLLRKGTTKLALFGISNLRDERMKHTFKHGRAKFLRPSIQTDEFFNILSIHQNHHAHTKRGVFPEDYIPDYMDAVIWGHEHECLIDPQINLRKGFSVIQPGSSIATSLIEGEAVPKHVAILSITEKKFTIEKFRLKTVRPFVIETVVLATDSSIKQGGDNKGQVTRWLEARVNDLIEQAQNEWISIQKESEREDEGTVSRECPLPLIRLKVEYSGDYQVENPTRFSNRFVGRVANVDDVVHYFRRKPSSGTSRGNKMFNGEVIGRNSVNNDRGLEMVQVEELIGGFLKTDQMNLLHEKALSVAINDLVNKEDKSAVKQFFEKSLEVQSESLVGMGVQDVKAITTALEKANISSESIKERLEESKGKESGEDKPTTSKRGRRGTRGSNKGVTRGGTRGRGRKKLSDDEDDDYDLSEMEIIEQTPSTNRHSTRTRKPPNKSQIVESISESDQAMDVDDLDNDPEVVVSNDEVGDEPSPPPLRKTTAPSRRKSKGKEKPPPSQAPNLSKSVNTSTSTTVPHRQGQHRPRTDDDDSGDDIFI